MCDFNAYIGSCGEYLAVVKNPIAFYGDGFGAMIKPDQGDWAKHFTAWSAMQFLAGVFVGIGVLIGWAAYGWFGSGIAALIEMILRSWFNAHLFWFLATKANCCNVPILYLLGAIGCAANGWSTFFQSLGWLSYSIAFIVSTIASFVQSIACCEMALGMFKMWQGAGKTGAAGPPTPAAPADKAEDVEKAAPVEEPAKTETA